MKQFSWRPTLGQRLCNILKSHIMLWRRTQRKKKTGAVKYTAQDEDAMLKRCRRDQLQGTDVICTLHSRVLLYAPIILHYELWICVSPISTVPPLEEQILANSPITMQNFYQIPNHKRMWTFIPESFLFFCHPAFNVFCFPIR